MMFFRFHALTFSLNVLKFLRYLTILLIVFSLCFYFEDSSITFCMEATTQTTSEGCTYVVNNEGNIQVHPLTNEPLKDCWQSKTDFAVAMETIERVAEKATTAIQALAGAITEASPSTEASTSSDISSKTFSAKNLEDAF